MHRNAGPRKNRHATPCRILLLCLAGWGWMNTGVAQQSQGNQQAALLDWVPMEQLSPAQQARVPTACCGLYVEPPLPGPVSEELVMQARQADYDESGRIAILEGEVLVQQRDRLVRGERGRYDEAGGRFTLQGDVRIRQPGLLLTGSDAMVDNTSGTSTLNNASYLLHQEAVRGSADVIVYTDADGIITIDNGRLSRCEPGDADWLISGEHITLDQEAGQGVARNVTLRVGNVPLLYTPWIRFPINDQRSSGFLAPIIGSTRDGGRDISIPYYFNLAPNYDATLTGRLLTERGLLAGLEFRHLGRRSRNTLNMQYLPGDDLYDPLLAGQADSDSPPTDDRWLLSVDHRGRPVGNWQSMIDYNAVSDEDYFQDLGNTGLELTTQSFLYRSARLNYTNDNWRFSLDTLGYQLIDPNVPERNRPYDRLPRLTVDGIYFGPRNLEYGLATEYVTFDRNLDRDQLSQTAIGEGALTTGQRLSLEPRIGMRWSTPGSFLAPTLKYKYARYQLEDQAQGDGDSPSRGIAMASVDGGLIFERPLQWRERDLVQTLEPRAYYLYSEYEDQSDIPLFDSSAMTFSYNQLFREDRFSGKDRVGDANQLTLAVTSRLLDRSGREKASASIGQIQYFEDRRVTLRGQPGNLEGRDTSSLAADFSYQFNPNWRAYGYLEWDTGDNTVDVGNFQFRYQSDINHIFNIAYRYRDVPNRLTASGIDRRINQTDISAVWPLPGNWGLLGRWNYDHANDRNLETILGVEYNHCCWNLRLIAREWIDNDRLFFGTEDSNTGIFLQFELKGFGSVLGGNVTGILNNGITGYREREYAQ